ncbi:aspartate aminotransferase family protein [Aquibaculum sediminis]|uniref:aspartate aminotransferase family protein n=1 Tax=Aquibaculum sediminis TaxID=3231907 RepID=UPI003451BBD8
MHLWVNQHRRDQRLPKVAHGQGCELFDDQGKRYLDGSGGPALFSLGYAHPEVNAAISEQLSRIQFGYSTTFTSDAIDGLAEMIAEEAGPELKYTSFVSGGSEATETAIKVALQYHAAQGNPGRTHFIARRQSWHGYTLGSLSISGHLARRRPYENVLMPVTFVSPANEYRPPLGVAPEGLTDHLARELEEAILRIGPGKVAGFIFEPVVGAAGGAVPCPPGYAQKVREICDRYGVLMIADEVMCGIGRCGSWRALALEDDCQPDIMTIAKGMGGGYMPLGACVYRQSVYEAITDQYGTVASVHTYSGHTLACAAGLAVLQVIRRDGLVEKCRRDGDYLMDALRKRFGQTAHAGDIRGRGLFVAIELVEDRDSKRPFPPERKMADRVRAAALEEGLICYPSSGTVDGINGDHVLLSPPYIATQAEFDEMVEKLAKAFTKLGLC